MASRFLAFSLARTLGFGPAYDALVVAVWAWLPLIEWQFSGRRAVAAATAYQASVAGVIAALVMLWLKPEPPHLR